MPKQHPNGSNNHTSESNGDFVLEPNTLIIEDQSLRYGFIQLPKQILYARNLSHSAKLLYSVLLGYAWQEQSCFPGYDRLEEDMQAGRKMIRRYMRELEVLGLISQRRRGQGKTNIYILHDLRKVQLVLPESLKGQNDPSRRVKRTPLNGSKEPLNNNQSNNKQNTNNVVVKQPPKISKKQAIKEPPHSEVYKTLVTFGVKERVAQPLAENYPEEYIADKLAFTQWLVEQGSPLVKRNPAGFLIAAIEQDIEPHKTFETPSRRKARTESQAKAAAAAAEERKKAEQEYRQAQAEIQRRIRDNHPPEPVGKDGLTTETAWALTLEKMETQISLPMFQTWLKNTMLVSIEGKNANVVVPNQLTAEWLDRRLYQSLNRTFRDIIGREVDFRFVPAAVSPHPSFDKAVPS